MRSGAAAALALVLSAAAAGADTRTAQYGAPFCETLPSFNALIKAMVARDEAAAAHLDDCTFIKPGVRIDVLREYADFGGGQHDVQIRLYGNCTSVDGYTLSNDVEPAP